MSDCTHGMPTPASCIDCMAEGNLPVPRREAPVVEATFLARFDGDCRSCHLGIHVGQRIARMSDDTYRHAVCVAVR